MEINNLSQNQSVSNFSNRSSQKKNSSFPLFAIILILAITSGFFISRFVPGKNVSTSSTQKNTATSTESLSSGEEAEVGKTYGNTGKNFSDTATGTIEQGSINGEGTHILVRTGGLSQRVSLTSSNLDLDLFVGHEVEIKGETNASTKTGWLVDVGSIKVIK
jgi:hypothetical protein